MMTQFRKRRFAVLRLGAAIPVVAAMMMLCSFTVKLLFRQPGSGPADRYGTYFLRRKDSSTAVL